MTTEELSRSSSAVAPPTDDAAFERLFDSIDEGFCIIEMLFDAEDRPVDYRFLRTNPLFEEQTGLTNAVGRTARELVPNLEDFWFEVYGRVALTGESARFENGSEPMGRWFDVYAAPFGHPARRHVAIVFRDISARRQAQTALAAAEQDLRDSEERARLAVDLARLGTWTYDVESEIAIMDARMCEIWRRPVEQSRISLPEAVSAAHPDDRERMQVAMGAALDPAGSGSYEIEYRIVLADGVVVWLDARGVTRFAGTGTERRPVSIIGTAADVSLRRRSEELVRANEAALARELAQTQSLQRLSSIMLVEDDVNSLYEGLLDAAISIMGADMASLQMFDAQRGGLQLLASRGFHPQSAAFWEWVTTDSDTPCGAALISKERSIVEDLEDPATKPTAEDLEHFRLSGIRAAQSTPLISRDGRLLGMISTHWRSPHVPSAPLLALMDVVARQAADVLERRAAEQELRRALAAKDEFLALVSHELRTPITTVLGNANVLARVGDRLSAPERASALGDIRDQAERLTSTIDDLLAIARAERGVLEVEPVAIGRTLQRIVTADAEVGKALELRGADTALIVNGDEGAISHVVRNFISNAVKYGEGSLVEVELVEQATEVLILVMDRGSGVLPAEVDRLFESFYRAGDVTKVEGLGIGLSVCKRLAEAVGGRVFAAPREGGGSTFGLALPLYDDGSA